MESTLLKGAILDITMNLVEALIVSFGYGALVLGGGGIPSRARACSYLYPLVCEVL